MALPSFVGVFLTPAPVQDSKEAGHWVVLTVERVNAAS